MRWIKYQIVQSVIDEETILIEKKVGYSEANIAIAQAEAYNGEFTIEEDGTIINEEPIAIELGGTGAKTAEGARNNLGVVSAPTNTSEVEEGFIFQNKDGSTILAGGIAEDKFKYSIVVDNGVDGTPNAAEYYDDCAGFIEASGSNLGDWANTKLVKEYFRPCVIKPGSSTPEYYLQQDNMTLKEDGSAAVLTGADGDVMIEIKKLYGKFVEGDGKLKIYIMNYKEDDSCFCFNEIAGEERDVVYRGVYKAGVASGAGTVMRSISGVKPLASTSLQKVITYAKNRGDGYHLNNFYMLMLYQCMYLLMYKNRDSQSALGKGNTNANNVSPSTSPTKTGWSNDKPFCWGDQNDVNGVKFLGVEDFYGNVSEFVGGLIINDLVCKLTKDPSNYGDDATKYEITAGTAPLKVSGGYIKKMQVTGGALLPSVAGGSSTTYFCDALWTPSAAEYGSCFAMFGGVNEGFAGAFCWNLVKSYTAATAREGSRLCRK